MKNEMHRIIKALLFIALIALLGLLVGCDAEPPRWKNTYIQFYPDNMETLYVRQGRGTFQAEENGANYLVDFNKENQEFTLRVTSFNHPIHFGYFDGYAGKSSEEIEWVHKANTIIATGKFLEGYEFYEISLSVDKTR